MKRFLVLLMAIQIAVIAHSGVLLENPGFEEYNEDLSPVGWTVLAGLDTNTYGDEDNPITPFTEAPIPRSCPGGFRSDRALAYPCDGSWFCPVFQHNDGIYRGKAVVSQTVKVEPGKYQFGCMLRTADGQFYAGAFSLGMSLGSPKYADDDSTGILWSEHNLAMRSNDMKGVRDRGEWDRYWSPTIKVTEPGPITVWIRFNYVNQNQFEARWQVDDAILQKKPEKTEREMTPSCGTIAPHARLKVFCGYENPEWIVTDHTTIVSDLPQTRHPHIRLFRKFRRLQDDQTLHYRLPVPAGDRPLSLLVQYLGDLDLQVNGRLLPLVASPVDAPVTREFRLLPDESAQSTLDLVLTSRNQAPVFVYELELGRPSRTEIRVSHAEQNIVDIPWVIGSWDGSSREFESPSQGSWSNPDVVTGPLAAETGVWDVSFTHTPKPGHLYSLIYGLVAGKAKLDVGANGLVEWVATTKGQEIVDVDVTDLLEPGANTLRVETIGSQARIDFMALAEICPTAQTPPSQLSFSGTQDAETITKVIENTWFWVKELHWEPSGFVDASVPHGNWYNEHWPIDIAFAFREFNRWGYKDMSLPIAELAMQQGWAGHPSNRSGSDDNTGGNMLIAECLSMLARSDYDERLLDVTWERIQEYAREVMNDVDESPFGLLRGTNWENAGNLEHGTCYALSTNLGAAAALLASASLAERMERSDLAESYQSTAHTIRQNVYDHLLLTEDHVIERNGFVMPAGSWAYGLRPDGSYEDQPLAGYFWGATAMTDIYGQAWYDELINPVYLRTLDPAVSLFVRNEFGVVSGYSTSYDGPGATLVAAALYDRLDLYEPMLQLKISHLDVDKNVGSKIAELSRWAVGAPGDVEDTNLVLAADFLHTFRIFAGVDDTLRGTAQISLSPRLPLEWIEMTINDWAVRTLDADNQPQWNNLQACYTRSEAQARMWVAFDEPVPGFLCRLGPFEPDSRLTGTVDGKLVEVRAQDSGPFVWGWVTCDIDSETTITVIALKK